MKKAIFLSITLSIILTVLVIRKTSKDSLTADNPTTALPVVAITQIVEHPALDAERNGVIKALQNAGFEDGKNIKIIYKNAQGNISTSAQIAQNLISENPKVIIAISTPSAQSCLKACQEKNIPLVFGAVSDPVEAKLITTLQKRTELVVGVSDSVPISMRLQFIRNIAPHLKKLGVIYNPGAANSSNIVRLLKEEAQKKGIEIIEATANKSSEVDGAMRSLAGKIEALYIPDDNTAASSISSIIKIGEQLKIPVFSCDTSLMASGIVATYGYSHFTLGEVAGDMVVKILKGTMASDILIPSDIPVEFIISAEASKRAGLELPAILPKEIKFYKE
ncbi:MAG: ABC transporter substrate-binding protein [Alphaproteobacteria bacterium]|nr:ABC transporter substrate-binding protein [Alphaproteobacteria bacterium]